MENIAKLLGILVVVLWGCSLEDPIPENNLIAGKVTNSSEVPLAGVTVKLTTVDKEFSTQTDNGGNYSFSNVRSGLGVLVFNMEGYYERKRNISIGADKEFDITLRNFQDDYFFSAIPDNLILENYQTEAKIHVNTNAGFKVKYTSDWLTCSPLEAETKETVTLTFNVNETEQEKVATITLEGQYDEIITVKVKQKAGPVFKVLSKRITEYVADANKDGIEFECNLPVSNVIVRKPGTNVLFDVNVEKLNGGKTVILSGFSLSPFESISYQVDLISDREELLKEEFGLIAYYKHYFNHYDVGIRHMVLPDGKHCLVDYWNSNGLHLYTWPDMERVQSTTEEHVRTYTKYLNSLIYVFNEYEPSLISFRDIMTNEIKKNVSIEFPVNPFTDKEYIQSIVVMENGMGVISTGYRMYKVDFSYPDPQVEEFKNAEIMMPPHNIHMPNVDELIDNERKILCYAHGHDNHSYIIDTQTWEVKVLPSSMTTSGKSLVGGKQSASVLVNLDGRFHLVNSDTNTSVFISGYPLKTGLLIEKEGKTTHVLFSSHRNGEGYIYDVVANKTVRIDTKNFSFDLYPGSYTTDYILMGNQQNNYSRSEYYIVNADYFTNYPMP